MEQHIRPLTLGDMFDRTFRVLGTTFWRNAALGVILFLPGTILLAYGLHEFTSIIANLITSIDPNGAGPEAFEDMSWDGIFPVLATFLGSMLILGLGALLLSLASLLAGLAMMRINAASTQGEQLEWIDALRHVSGIVFLRSIGQSLLQGLAMFAMFVVPYALIFTGVDGLIVVGVLGILGVVPVMIWLSIRWIFCQTVIAVEDDTAVHSFSRSGYLVRDHWWRTLGIMMLFSITGSFAIQIVTAPLALVAMWGFFKSYIEMIMNMSSGDGPSPVQIAGMLRSLGIGYAAFIALTTLLTQLFTAAYVVIMYFDLRARKGEFPDPVTADDVQLSGNDEIMSFK